MFYLVFSSESFRQPISLKQWLIVLYIEGDACDELKQKQNRQSPCFKAVNRGRQVDSTDGQKALTTGKKRAVGSPRASDQGNTIII